MKPLPWWKRWLAKVEPPKVVTLFQPHPVTERECPACGETVTVWRTYRSGVVRCVACPVPEDDAA